jgi:hypothetical protein
LKWADTPSTAAVGLRDAMTAHLSLVLALILAVSALGHCSQRQTIADLRASAAAADGLAVTAQANASEAQQLAAELRACVEAARLAELDGQRAREAARAAEAEAQRRAAESVRLRRELYARDDAAAAWGLAPVPAGIAERWR